MHLKMFKILPMAGIVAALIILFSVVAGAETIIAIDHIFRIQTIDIDSDPGKKFTCTHAAMANAIAAATGASQEDAVDLYRDLVDHLGDRPIAPSEAWAFIMDTVQASGKARYANFYSYAGVDQARLVERIVGSILEAKMVTISIYKSDKDLGHALTVYGVVVKDDKSFSLIYCDNEDGSYKKHTGLTWKTNGKTYMRYRDGSTVQIRGYATVRVTESVIGRGLRK